MSALPPTQELRERVDTAQVLTRFHYLSRAIALACGGWIAATPKLETKAALARVAWQHTLAGDTFRERVFELRYPTRFLEEGSDAPLIRVYEAAIDAPGPDEFLGGLAHSLLPEYAVRLGSFLAQTDELDDGPTVRIVQQALRDVEEQAVLLGHAPGSDPWTVELRRGLETLEPPAGTPFRLAEEPARDDAYFSSSFYWPDAIVPGYPYGEGVALQVRSAVSHLNEVWAVDTAGAILHGLAPELGWEWIRDAGRWTYDEARHMLMGKRRLEAWGLGPPRSRSARTSTRPAPARIRSTASGCSATSRRRTSAASESAPPPSTRWATRRARPTWSSTGPTRPSTPSTAAAGSRTFLAQRGEDPESWPAVLERCEQLVAERVARATPEDRARITAAADALVAEATRRVA